MIKDRSSTPHRKRHPQEPKRKVGWKQRAVINLQRLFDYLENHPCVDCGESDVVVLEFDHVKGRKRASISALVHAGETWDEIMKEIQLCEVRCANDHRRRHAREGKFFMYRTATPIEKTVLPEQEPIQ